MLPTDRAGLEAFCRDRARVVPVDGPVAAVRVLGGPLLLVDTRDVQIAAHLAMDGFWESWLTAAVVRHARPGWRCVDVGANWGYYTVLLASLAGPGGRVWAWEPNPAVARCLRETIRLNGFGRTTAVVEAAAVDQPGACELFLPATEFVNTLNASLTIRHPGGRTVAVAGRPLDDVCDGRIDFVKVDAEGAEPRVWAGMTRVRRENPGLAVLLEFNPGRYADPAGFLAAITDDGFALRCVGPDGGLLPATADELCEPTGDDRMLWLSREV